MRELEEPGSRDPPSSPAASAAFLLDLFAKYGDPAEPPPLREPRRLGKYLLEAEIARGGMGVVYRAREVGLERRVAVKTVLSGEHASPEQVRRFQAEALAAARLDHPHIVPIYDTGEAGGCAYFAMKLLEGGSLAAHVPRFRGAPLAAAELTACIARAVHFAHQRGVLHRDLKPANVVFDREGRPHVTDFGLARQLDRQSVTASGQLVGTLAYMAPEQAGGPREAVTTAADVYSLGAILYELLSSRPPFTGTGPGELLRQVLHEEPRLPSELEPSVPRDLETICLKCLEKTPGDRYAHAAALAEDLERFIAGKPIQARPARLPERAWKWARRRPAAAALLCVLAAIGPAAALWHHASLRERAAGLAAREALARRHLYAARLNLAFDAWRSGVYPRARDLLESLRPEPGEEDLRDFGWRYLDRVSHPELHSLAAHASRVQALRFLPGGSRLLSAARNGELALQDARSGADLARFPSDGTISFPALSRDGQFAVQVRSEPPASWGLRVWALEERGEHFSWREALKVEAPFNAAGFSPDGAVLAGADAAGRLHLWETATWEARLPPRSPGTASGFPYTLEFSPDRELLAACSDLGDVYLVETATLAVARVLSCPQRYTSHLAFAPGGDLFAALAREGQVDVFTTGSWERKARLDTQAASALAFSADGRTLALGAMVEESPAVELWDLETSTRRRLLRAHAARIASIAFDAAGDLLATGSEDGAIKVWDLETPEEPVRRESDDRYEGLALSAGGDTCIAVRRGFALEVLALAPRGLGAAPVHRGTIAWSAAEHRVAAVSPDGAFAALAGEDGTVRIEALRIEREPPVAEVEGRIAAGRRVVQLAFAPRHPRLLVAGEDGRISICERGSGVDAGRWRETGSFTAGIPDAGQLVVSPDGKLLAITRERQAPVALRDIVSGRLEATLVEHAAWVLAAAFRHDGRLLATGGLDRQVLLWDLDAARDGGNPRPLRRLRGHSNAVTALAFFPDGKSLASASDDTTVKLWDPVTGEERATLRGHGHHVNALAISARGEALVSAGGKRGRRGDVVFWLAALDERAP
jgi:WD40 repeat protein